jgi:hypothetical protein
MLGSGVRSHSACFACSWVDRVLYRSSVLHQVLSWQGCGLDHTHFWNCRGSSETGHGCLHRICGLNHGQYAHVGCRYGSVTFQLHRAWPRRHRAPRRTSYRLVHPVSSPTAEPERLCRLCQRSTRRILCRSTVKICPSSMSDNQKRLQRL